MRLGFRFRLHLIVLLFLVSFFSGTGSFLREKQGSISCSRRFSTKPKAGLCLVSGEMDLMTWLPDNFFLSHS